MGSGGVQFRTGRKALLPQASDENLREDDPFARIRGGCTQPDVAQHIRDGFHFRNRMIEFVHGGLGGVHVRVDQRRAARLALQIDPESAGTDRRPASARLPTARVAADGDGIRNPEFRVHRDDLAVHEDQIRGLRVEGSRLRKRSATIVRLFKTTSHFVVACDRKY
jgi:hypothetical protein